MGPVRAPGGCLGHSAEYIRVGDACAGPAHLHWARREDTGTLIMSAAPNQCLISANSVPNQGPERSAYLVSIEWMFEPMLGGQGDAEKGEEAPTCIICLLSLPPPPPEP